MFRMARLLTVEVSGDGDNVEESSSRQFPIAFIQTSDFNVEKVAISVN